MLLLLSLLLASAPAAPGTDAGRARYEATEEAWNAFRALPVEGAGPELKGSLQRKAEALNQLVRQCEDVARAHAPRWTVAALVRAGEAHLEFAARMRAVKTPPEVSRAGPEATAAYRDLLEEQAKSLTERAQHFLERAAELAKAEGLHTPESALAERRLSELAR